MYGERSLMSMR